MKATEIYSWRVERELKEALEAAARSERSSIAKLLSRIVRDWLRCRYDTADDETAQQRIREAGAQYLGSVRGGDASRAGEAGHRTRQMIRDKHAARRTR